MDSVNKRIKEIRSHFNLSQIEFSKQICISQTTIGDIEIGGRKVKNHIIELISLKFGINKDWIKTGNGGMFDKEKPDIRLEYLIEIYNKLDRKLQEYLIEQSESLLKLNNENTTAKK